MMAKMTYIHLFLVLYHSKSEILPNNGVCIYKTVTYDVGNNWNVMRTYFERLRLNRNYDLENDVIIEAMIHENPNWFLGLVS